ncbi:hypothetical protein [Pseudonocardia nigra]|uniref:hypothetical protein n=1 Tax=Pseudonocardia nigra TaxID=1921578 RepID=UPI001C606EC6|nr:hypothetical protein [Pseudonocardia nigra]
MDVGAKRPQQPVEPPLGALGEQGVAQQQRRADPGPGREQQPRQPAIATPRNWVKKNGMTAAMPSANPRGPNLRT